MSWGQPGRSADGGRESKSRRRTAGSDCSIASFAKRVAGAFSRLVARTGPPPTAIVVASTFSVGLASTFSSRLIPAHTLAGLFSKRSMLRNTRSVV